MGEFIRESIDEWLRQKKEAGHTKKEQRVAIHRLHRLLFRVICVICGLKVAGAVQILRGHGVAEFD